MAKEGTILVIDDNKSILSALEILLGRYFEKVVTIPDPNRIPQMLRDDRVDVALLDMPFYTTKPDGSGIGLSLSRQIMRLHDGSIRLTSNIPGRVTFTLQFR